MADADFTPFLFCNKQFLFISRRVSTVVWLFLILLVLPRPLAPQCQSSPARCPRSQSHKKELWLTATRGSRDSPRHLYVLL